MSSRIRANNLGTLLNGVALTAAASARTIELTLDRKYRKLVLNVTYTYGAATAVVLAPSRSLDAGATYCAVQARAISSGAGTLSAYTDSKTTSGANQSFSVEYDVEGVDRFKLVFSGTGSPTGADLITVQAVAVGE